MRFGRGRFVFSVLGCTLGTFSMTAVAGASDVHSPDTGIVFTAAAGEQNAVTIGPSPSAGMVRLSEQQINLRAGFGCVQIDARSVDCPRRSRPVNADLGDNGDTLDVIGGTFPVRARGGDGNDDILAFGAGASASSRSSSASSR